MSLLSSRFNLLKYLQFISKSIQNHHIGLATSTSPNQINEPEKTPESTGELDTLYKYLELQLKGHDPPVLDSYEKFVLTVSDELGIPFVKSERPRRDIYRKPLLKSKFIFKDHRVFYEWRTHFLNLQFKNLTGSTADTFLEYVQRNLPEGVHMTVVKTALAKFPDHLNRQQALASE